MESKHYEYADNAWVLESTNKRYYDDYNLIYETTDYADGRASEVRKYYYGLDLLGGLYGTAGTGGLRMMEIDDKLCYVFNNQVGSIENLYSAAGGGDSQAAGTLLAEYTYSAYGDVLMKSGELADKNHVTYSTRYSEGNTGLIYYTYRHYAPRLHKWINKDPIGEQGGINLYQMVENDPIGNFDVLGYILSLNPIQSSKYYHNGEAVTFDQLPDIERCPIEIFVGHGSDVPFSNDEGTYNKALQARNRQTLDPNTKTPKFSRSEYASSAVGCNDDHVNAINYRAGLKGNNFGFDNPNRVEGPRRGISTSIDSIKIALDKEIDQAKKHADSAMLKKDPPKAPACCDKVKIKVIIIVGDRNNWIANYLDALQNFNKSYGDQYKNPIIYP